MVWKFKLYPNSLSYGGFVLKGNYLVEMNGHKLLTRDRLPFIDDLSCVLCSGPLESLDHLYFGCAFSSRLWFTVKEGLHIHYSMTTIIVALKWFKQPFIADPLQLIWRAIGFLLHSLFYLESSESLDIRGCLSQH